MAKYDQKKSVELDTELDQSIRRRTFAEKQIHDHEADLEMMKAELKQLQLSPISDQEIACETEDPTSSPADIAPKRRTRRSKSSSESQ